MSTFSEHAGSTSPATHAADALPHGPHIHSHHFALSPAVAHLPLARRRQRLGAMAIDLALLGVIVEVFDTPALVVAVPAGIALFWAASRAWAPAWLRAPRARAGLAIALCLALVGVGRLFAVGHHDVPSDGAVAHTADENAKKKHPKRIEFALAGLSGPEALQLATTREPAVAQALAEKLAAAMSARPEREELAGQLLDVVDEGNLPVSDVSRAELHRALAPIAGEDAHEGVDPRIAALERRKEKLEEDVDRLEAANEDLKTQFEHGRGLIHFAKATAKDLGLGFGWSYAYFIASLAFWDGRTPGKRLLRIRVVRTDGKPFTWWRSWERFHGYAASMIAQASSASRRSSGTPTASASTTRWPKRWSSRSAARDRAPQAVRGVGTARPCSAAALGSSNQNVHPFPGMERHPQGAAVALDEPLHRREAEAHAGRARDARAADVRLERVLLESGWQPRSRVFDLDSDGLPAIEGAELDAPDRAVAEVLEGVAGEVRHDARQDTWVASRGARGVDLHRELRPGLHGGRLQLGREVGDDRLDLGRCPALRGRSGARELQQPVDQPFHALEGALTARDVSLARGVVAFGGRELQREGDGAEGAEDVVRDSPGELLELERPLLEQASVAIGEIGVGAHRAMDRDRAGGRDEHAHDIEAVRHVRRHASHLPDFHRQLARVAGIELHVARDRGAERLGRSRHVLAKRGVGGFVLAFLRVRHETRHGVVQGVLRAKDRVPASVLAREDGQLEVLRNRLVHRAAGLLDLARNRRASRIRSGRGGPAGASGGAACCRGPPPVGRCSEPRCRRCPATPDRWRAGANA